jgi:hypothetical protein
MIRKKATAKKSKRPPLPLFEEENHTRQHPEEETAAQEEQEKPKKREDKIFGNSFNLGNVEHEDFHEVKIEQGYATSNLADCYNTEEYNQRKEIMERVVETFNKSQWNEMPLGKKFPKEVLPYIFQELYLGLAGGGYTTVDMFICISEFMDQPYERVYEAAGVAVKERLIQELELSHGTLAKKKINRLF